MYCRKCGQHVLNDSLFCEGCGARVERKAVLVEDPPSPEEKWPYSFRSQWRNATRSPLFVVAAICFTVFHVVLLFYVLTITKLAVSEWKELDVVQYISKYVHSEELTQKMKMFEFWAGSSKFLLIISGFVSVVGIWSIYADSTSDDGGFIWLKVSQIIRCVGAVIAILTYNSLAATINSIYAGENTFGLLQFLSEERIDAINDGATLLCAPYWVMLVYSIVMYVVVYKIHGMAVSEVPQTGIITFAATAFFVAAVAFIFVANIWGALVGAYGLFMIKNYRVVEKLIDDYDKRDRGPISRPKSTHPGEWQCSCGKVNAGYVSSCVCGRNKRDV